jgi:glycosyltransferase involved in cell wall biosynthesis
MKIRVLHIIDHLGYGGAPIAVKNIAEKINNEHFETFVCALRTNPLAIPIKVMLTSLTYRKYNPCAFWAIAKLCKEYRIDIIHAHLQKSIISSLVASLLCNSKIAIHEHGAIFRGGTGFIYRLLLRLLRSKAAVVIANSQATKVALKQTARFPEESVKIINNFIDVARFDKSVYDREQTQQRLGIDKDKIAVGFVGRLDYCKGVDLMLDAAAQLHKEYDKYHFVVVGDGREKKRLLRQSCQSGLEEKVTFTGICENPAELMRAFDIGLIPSRREAFGITAVEFMRMGVPVIASPVGGLVELVQDGKTGIVLDRLKTDRIAEAIKRLGENEQLRDELAANAQAFSNKFDGNEQLRQLEDIYMTLAGTRPL